jgi:hypothetical protein
MVDEIESTDTKKPAGEAPVAWAFVSESDSRPAPWPEPFEGRQIAIAVNGGATTRRDLSRARRLTLETALAGNLARAPDLARYRDLDRVLESMLDPAGVLDLELDLDRFLAGAGARALDLDRLLTGARARALPLSGLLP